MPKRPVSKEQWEALVAAYRSAPGNANHASKTVPGVCYRLAKRAWDLGVSWADFPEAREPIKVLIAGEQTRQRAALVRQESTDQAIRQDAQRDVAKTRFDEAQMVRLGRSSTTALLVSLTRIATGAAQIGDAVADALKTHGAVKDEAGNPRVLTMPEVRNLVSLLAKVGATVKQVTEAAQGVIESERLVIGEPTQLIGIVHKLDDITQEEADKRMQAAMRALERAKSQGLFANPGVRALVLDAQLEPDKSKS